MSARLLPRRQPIRPGRTRQAGFTLIEVILAIGIVAVMVTLNYGILRGIIQAKKLIDDRRDGMYIANSLLNRMSRELQLATKKALLPGCDSAGGAAAAQGSSRPAASTPGTTPVLIGSAGLEGSSITFLAKEAGQYVPDGGTHSGIVQITYRVAEDPEQDNSGNGTLVLVREEVPYTKPVTKACKNVLRFPITNNLVSLQFRYFDGKTREWTESWSGPQALRLPQIIQFTVSLKSPAGTIQTYTSAVHLRSAI